MLGEGSKREVMEGGRGKGRGWDFFQIRTLDRLAEQMAKLELPRDTKGR